MSGILGTLLCAALIVVASVVIGRAGMLLLGWRRPEWVAGAVGFAALVVIAPFLLRLPGRGLTAAIILLILTLACAIVTRRAVPAGGEGRNVGVATPGASAGMDAEDGASRDAKRPRGAMPTVRPRETKPDGPRAHHKVALVIVPITLALACLPFLFNERTGVLGEGIYTNDHAAQLYWADWLADGFGPQPNAVQFGYPVGPQALAATVSEGTTVSLVDAFNGMLIAIPALTALAALSALAALPPWRRGIAAVLTGIPYLGASFLAQSGFKETAMAMFVVALGVVMHLATRRESEAREAPPARAVLGVLAVLIAAAVFTFSIPGGVWFGVAIPVWAILLWGFGRSRLDLAALRAAAGERRRALAGGAIALVALTLLVIGPAGGFIERIDDVQESSGRLASPVFPGEALGIWPEGDFRIVRGEVTGAFAATGFAALCALGAALALVRRREWGLLSALVAAAFVYALARPFAQIHVEAKALAVLAPIVMLVTTRWLLQPGGPTRAGRLRLATGVVFCALAGASTLLALRAAPVGFDEGGESLQELARTVDGEAVVFLGVDRFAAYDLRGTLVESPGGYVPPDVSARPEKTWQQGLALDFDTLSPHKLDDYSFAVTTAAAYASTPPPNWAEVQRAGAYVLWERSGPTPRQRVLSGEGGEPGQVLDCRTDLVAEGRATVLTRPVTIDQDRWQPGFAFDAPATRSVTVGVPPGSWSASLQYHSQAPLTVAVDGRPIAELPPTLEGFYLTGAGRGAFWPAGEIGAGPGGPAELTIEAAEPSALQRALGVERKVWLGTLALSRQGLPPGSSLARSCGDYVDHYVLEAPPSER